MKYQVYNNSALVYNDVAFKPRKKTNIKIIIILTFVLLLVAMVVFLFFNHKDTLSNYVPENVSFYAHANPAFIHELTINHQKLIYDFAPNLQISDEQFRSILRLAKKEMAIIKQPYQSFQIVTYKNQGLIDFLNQQGISVAEKGKVLYFPQNVSEVNNNLSSLKKAKHYQSKKIDFSKIKLFVSGEEIIIFPDFLVENTAIKPFYGYVYYPNQVFEIKTTLEITKIANFEALISELPEKTEIWANNLDLSKMPLNASVVEDNLKYKILKEIEAPAEYLQTDEGFALILKGKTADIERLKALISYNIALLLPEEQEKELPDGTIAVNLVANPENWLFINNEMANRREYELNVEPLKLKIRLFQMEGNILLLNNLDLADLQMITDENNLESIFGISHSCSTDQKKNKTKTFIYINPKLVGLNSINRIWLYNTTHRNKLAVCID